MYLPILDPNVVLWLSVVSSVVTTLASLGACLIATRHYLHFLRDRAEKIF